MCFKVIYEHKHAYIQQRQHNQNELGDSPVRYKQNRMEL